MYNGNCFGCLNDVTKDEYTIFAKNCDSNPNESSEVVMIPELKINNDTIINCTYTDIKTPKLYTHQCILCKPLWCWGAKCGVNIKGVCIGITSVFSKHKERSITNDLFKIFETKKDNLIGMDLVRLGLMFGDNADDTAKIIGHFLNKYNQYGISTWKPPMKRNNIIFNENVCYNSFMVMGME